VRHRGKIEATIGNARAYQEVEDFAGWCWDWVGGAPIQNDWPEMTQVPGETPLSREVSKALKSLGFKFCGPTIVYAWMQATGMVNDHLTVCPRHAELGGGG